tara:strand:+ start:698 stop:853 length:156 start_codon:yes stop_codon:yes gene_type:complete
MGKPKKQKSKSDQAIEFLRGYFGDKSNKSPVADIVRSGVQREKDYKKHKLK